MSKPKKPPGKSKELKAKPASPDDEFRFDKDYWIQKVKLTKEWEALNLEITDVQRYQKCDQLLGRCKSKCSPGRVRPCPCSYSCF